MPRLQDKIALVTGSSQGIGQGVAIRLAQEGAKIIVNYHSNPEGGEETVKAIQAAGSDAIAVQADLGQTAEIDRLIKAGADKFGRIDILVNNAGLEKRAPFWEVTESDYDLVQNVNLRGVFFTTQAFVKDLMARKAPGRIINMSSVHEELPFPHFASYCASKGGLKMLCRNLAIELAPFNITVNNVAPGAIETPINTKLLNDKDKLAALLSNIPLKRLGKPADVAGAVVYLASEDASYVTGTTLFVDGGLLWNYEEQ
ncbi:MAG TPA: glucose 1-dehydrogenase [Chthoniobacteraceae bacterium]|jgi:glucose 1-dehydrogenase|nr:glucose 1-dehydrogenase [Chthoniobacteraceae bacterium]